MRQIRVCLILLYFFSFIFLLSSCGPAIKYTAYVKSDIPKTTTHNIMIIGPEFDLPKNAVILGDLIIGGAGLVSCDYYDTLYSAQERARAVGGDAIQIIEVISPDTFNDCFRMKAKVIAFPQSTRNEKDEFSNFGRSLALNPNLIPITNLSKRISITRIFSFSSKELSLLPPQEKGWYTPWNSRLGELYFYKNGKVPMQTYQCETTFLPVDKNFTTQDEFLEFVKQSKQSDIDTKGFKNIEHSYNLNKRYSSYCVEYKQTATDTKHTTSDETNLIIKKYGYIFVHPKLPKYIVDIGYSEKGIDKDFTSSFQKIGDEFIDNLIIK